ncbi:hypothetical protein RUM44_006547 [Polyplax serrata]|uniref:UDP-glucose 6-dehydrogenase n=1 Tax=Polyplax serrata TaxID=468196 RepID=A0ABR1AID7_POLSC
MESEDWSDYGCGMKIRDKVIKNICCIGCETTGLYTCCVIANRCPSLNVSIIDLSRDKILEWNGKKVPSTEPGLDDILRKCQNKNLRFTTETENAIIDADIIFLSLNNELKETGHFIGMKMGKIEEMARLICKLSETNKIVVGKTTMPVGCSHFLAYVLDQNKQENVKFQVLSNPDFCSAGQIIEYLTCPDRVIIGSSLTSQGLAAAEVLYFIYSKWVPKEKILCVNTWSAELGKLATNAFLAQKLATLSALSLICEESQNVDISKILEIYAEITGNSTYLEPSFRFGGKSLHQDLLCLIFMCRELKLNEMAEYWQCVSDMNDCHMKRFKKMIMAEFYQTLLHKRIVILGFAYKKGVNKADHSPASFLCKSLLSEGAHLIIYDPKVEKRHIIAELKNVRCPNWEENVTVVDDVYKAVKKANAIVCCTDWDEFRRLNFNGIYKIMAKPAYIFDGRKFLPHQSLMDLDFIVKTIGTNLQKKSSRKT